MSVANTEPSTPISKEPTSHAPHIPLPKHTESAASFLPSYDNPPPPLNTTVAGVLFWSPYRRLHESKDDSEFEKIKNDLSHEWTNCAMAVSLHADCINQ